MPEFRGIWNQGTFYYRGDWVVWPQSDTWYRVFDGQTDDFPSDDPINWKLDHSPLPKGKHDVRPNGRAVGVIRVGELVKAIAEAILTPYRIVLRDAAGSHGGTGDADFNRGVVDAADNVFNTGLTDLSLVIPVIDSVRWKHRANQHGEGCSGIDKVVPGANTSLQLLLTDFKERAVMSAQAAHKSYESDSYNAGVSAAAFDVEAAVDPPAAPTLTRDTFLLIAFTHGVRPWKNAFGNPSTLT